jgi:ABC-2 type transport system permease protein
MMSILFAMAKKDLKLLFRDKLTLFFTFGFPLLFAAFFGSIFSSGNEGSSLSVAVTDLDLSPESAQFVQHMEQGDELDVVLVDEQQAKESVRKGKKVAFIVIPEGFGKAYGSLFSGSPPELIVGVDPSRKAEAGMLEGVMMKLGIQRFEDALSNKDALSQQLEQSIQGLDSDGMPEEWRSLLKNFLPKMKDLVKQDDNGGNSGSGSGIGMGDALMPLKIIKQDILVQSDLPDNAYSITLPQGMYWAIMGVVMGFGVALVQEKSKGTMSRLVTAPISRVQILGGKALGCFLALLMVLCLFFILARFIFDVPVERPDKVLLAVLCVSTAFVGIMMFLAALGKTERGMASLGWGVMMVFAMFGGAMIPLMAMPAWMISISNFSPVKWAIVVFEGATWRQFSYAEMLLPCSIMLVLGVVLFLLGARLLKLEQ